MEDVLWNNEMDLCIALVTEIDKDAFIRDAKRTHQKLTGESLPEFSVSKCIDIWKLEVKI